MKGYRPVSSATDWANFIDTFWWKDLKNHLEDELEISRDALEGLIKIEGDPSVERLRGGCIAIRHFIEIIEGWADGSIPIAFEVPEENENA